MSAHIINGKELAKHRETLLQNKVDRFIKLNGRKPSLLAIELSDDPGSKLYLKLKQAAAERIGIEFDVAPRPPSLREGVAGGHVSQVPQVAQANSDGIFIQHPPRQKLREIATQHLGGQAGLSKKQIDEFWRKLADQIPPEKDVDCLTTENLNLIKQGKPRFLPATVKAVVYCLKEVSEVSKVPKVSKAKGKFQSNSQAFDTSDTFDTFGTLQTFLKGKSVVILGRSPILGLPLSWHLNSFGAKPDIIHSKTDIKNQKSKIKNADIIISAIGKPRFITGDMVKKGVVAIDCGSPVGDVDFSSVASKAFAITPVPGGVGPLTVVSLMENVVESAYLADRERS